MATRTRSILVENTIGKIFNGVVTISQGDASKLIAGTKPLTTKRTQGGSGKVALNIGGDGTLFIGPALLTSVTVTSKVASPTQNTVITIKLGTSYANASNVVTVTLPTGAKAATTSNTVTIPAGNYLYWDITSAGYGTKLVTVNYTYYSGY